MRWKSDSLQLSILFHLWPPKYKKSSYGCKQLGLKGYCSVIQRCFGAHLPCLQKVIAPTPRLQVHLIPGKLVRNHPQCFKRYLKPFFFPNQLVLDRTGLRVHLHGRTWWGWGKDLRVLGLWYPRSTAQQHVWLQPGFNLRVLHFNFTDIIKVAAFVVAMLLLFQQVCR